MSTDLNFAFCFSAVLFQFKAFQVVMKVLFCLRVYNHLIRMPPHSAQEASYHLVMNSRAGAYIDLTFIICLAAKPLPPEANTSYLIDFSAGSKCTAA